jgi:hypothetical protein
MPLVVKVRVVLFVGMAVALWLLLGRFGAVAAITIVVCRSAIESVFGIIYYGHVLGMTRRDLGQFSPLIRIAIGSAAAGLVAMLVRQALAGSRPIVMVLVCGTAFCAVYAAAILIMRVPTREERRSVVRTMAKWVPLPGKR